MAYSQQVGTSSAGQTSMQEEFTVRIPRDKKKIFTMMKFGTASTVDFVKMGEQPVKLERENNLKEYKSANDLDLLPKFGAGSEYGRELKEESRRKKYGIRLKKYNPEDQPWILKLGAGKQGKRFKGVREGTIAENTSYYIFTKAADGAFEAFPVGKWYNFTPIVKYKYLNSDEAEEEFTRRDKTLNYFNIMLKKRLRKEDDKDLDEDEPEGGKKKKGKKGSRNMILTDMDDWNDLDLSDDDDDEEEEDNEINGAKKKNTKGKKKIKKTKNSKKNSDDEAIEESDEGDYDDREVDYISDSGSSDSLSGPETEDRDKNDEKGVDEEKGLRNILDSDAEEDEEEEEKEEAEDETEEKEDKKEEKTKKGDDSSSSSSDDDSDIEKNVDSAIFMQRDKAVKKDNAETESKETEDNPKAAGDKKDKDKVDKGVKRKGDKNLEGKALPSKKHKSDDSEAMMEEAIRRYLTRKPMTTKDLLQKFRAKKLNMTNDQITHTIAQLLKKLNPDKTTINKKLYLSLKKPE